MKNERISERTCNDFASIPFDFFRCATIKFGRRPLGSVLSIKARKQTSVIASSAVRCRLGHNVALKHSNRVFRSLE